jgi:hypothetical protein
MFYENNYVFPLPLQRFARKLKKDFKLPKTVSLIFTLSMKVKVWKYTMKVNGSMSPQSEGIWINGGSLHWFINLPLHGRKLSASHCNWFIPSPYRLGVRRVSPTPGLVTVVTSTFAANWERAVQPAASLFTY